MACQWPSAGRGGTGLGSWPAVAGTRARVCGAAHVISPAAGLSGVRAVALLCNGPCHAATPGSPNRQLVQAGATAARPGRPGCGLPACAAAPGGRQRIAGAELQCIGKPCSPAGYGAP
jgi:hypothetical protein